ncbi:MAG TPA: hypothetical protein VD906_12255 [Caulobacteraceae bacterium]|nr:hypothetical protein [Caulobacteraceae bacterium]
MSRHNGFQFSIRPVPTGWAWSTYEQGSGRKLVEGAAATRAQAAACVIRCIATRAGAAEGR